MKRVSSLLALVCAISFSTTASGAEIAKSDKFTINLTGRLQLVGLGQRLDDQFRDDNRLYLFTRQARLGIDGNYDAFKFKVTLGFAGEDEARAPSPGVSLGLLDMFVDVPLGFLGNTYVRVGQFKVPYSLERLEDPGMFAFGDRSIQNVAFRIGRDYGFALHTNVMGAKGAVGIFSGGGRDVPERYLPQILGIPMLIARLGWDNGMYENAFAEKADFVVNGGKYAAYLNGVYLQDTQIGHSTVLNVRLGERPLLINANWNPYLTQSPTARGSMWQVGGDVATVFAAGPGAVVAEAELNASRYTNDYGSVGLIGGRAQVGYNLTVVDFTARYAVVRPDGNMTSGGTAVAGNALMHEVTPSITYRHSPNLRLVADMPILINAPVISERNIGTYVLTDHPDQASLLKVPAGATEAPGTASRMSVIQARLMFQGSF
jgi:hypothetical protein